MKVAIVGFGNVASHLHAHISNVFETVVYQRTPNNTNHLPLHSLDPSGFDLVVLATSDDQIETVANGLSVSNATIVHTSGSKPVSVLSQHPSHGVVYPFQTFTKGKEVDLKSIPLLIECTEGSRSTIEEFASALSSDIRKVSGEERKRLHLAAVFACNFTNHLLVETEEIMAKAGFKLEDVEHLVKETVSKAFEISPASAQTGPVVRGDEETMKMHRSLLSDDQKKLYQLMSDLIRKKAR